MVERTQQSVVFNALDREADIDVSERNLPHWFQVGSAIFVTFRTVDSLPKDVLLRMTAELRDWLNRNELPKELADSMFAAESSDRERLLEPLTIIQQREFKKLCDQLFHRSLDECHGACLFKEQKKQR